MNISRHFNNSHTAIEVLKRWFFLTLKTSSVQHPVSHLSSPSVPFLPYQQTRFRSTRFQFRGLTPSALSRLRDESILSPFVQVVSDDTNLLLPPEPPSRILERLDRHQYFLVEVVKNTPESPHAICKIVEKRAAREFEKKKAKPAKNLTTTTKKLELSWAIDDNDFRHRMRLLEQFLAGGRRVNVELENKGKVKITLPEKASGLVDKLKSFVNGLEGTREYREADGLVGGRLRLYFERKRTSKEDGREGGEILEAQADVKSSNPTEHDGDEKPDARLYRKPARKQTFRALVPSPPGGRQLD